MRTISVQPGQPGEGLEYNPKKRLPYPIHIDPETGTARWGKGEYTLVGFQQDFNSDIDLLADEFYEQPSLAIGQLIVLCDQAGRFHSTTTPITKASVYYSNQGVAS